MGDIDASQAHELKMLAIRIKNAGLARVAIEAAHGYMHDDLEDDVFLSSVRSQARQAGMLSALLDEEGIDTTHIVFVDDYNPDPSDGRHKQVLVVDDLIKEVTENGFEPELLMFESNMVSLAKEMMRIMDEDQSLVIRSDSGTGSLQDLVLSRRNIELYRGRDGMVSCAMLDAAFSLVKLTTIANGVVNILPRAPEGQGFSYSGQQRKMRTILSEHLGLRVPPVFNLFVNTDGAKNVIASGAHHILRKPRS